MTASRLEQCVIATDVASWNQSRSSDQSAQSGGDQAQAFEVLAAKVQALARKLGMGESIVPVPAILETLLAYVVRDGPKSSAAARDSTGGGSNGAITWPTSLFLTLLPSPHEPLLSALENMDIVIKQTTPPRIYFIDL